MAHGAKRRAEKLFPYGGSVGVGAQPRVLVGAPRVLIELMTQQDAHGGPDGASSKQANGPANDFPGEFHALL